jgi:hypothetical protein
MSTPMERVWGRMKSAAAKAARRKTLISMGEAERAVLTICHLEQAAPPPPDALEYLSSELVRMSQRRNEAVGDA